MDHPRDNAMPKTIHNSTPCAACHRLMPRKSGKRKTCSQSCNQAARVETNRQRSVRAQEAIAFKSDRGPSTSAWRP
jgi:hypothetical protein